ncbi:MAG: esterase-like activity of phytase family protein [Ignavibacteriaceae bacterium]|nr:esterase-like activity of phytase family protein [Ignavibacteriaceae bacterium]
MSKSFSILCSVILLLIISSAILIFPQERDSAGLKIHPANNYPRWLKNDVYKTNQTSGITFLREKDDGTKEFLLADDIGKIHRLFIQDDTLFSFTEIKFNGEVLDYLSDFPKLDFEEIVYDKFTSKVYISIEGNGDNHLLFHGVFELKFKDNNVFQDSVVELVKLNFTPNELFYNYLESNTGYEGLAVDEKFFYFGVESILSSEGSFSGHTVIRIADKNSLEIVKEISTEGLDISTVCGLYSDENYSLWCIDRNHRQVFKLLFDEYFTIVDLTFFEFKTVIPKYNQLEYTGSLESITVASEKFLFLVDDPWHTFFIPPNEILDKLDESTINNFKNYLPIIYKFKIE